MISCRQLPVPCFLFGFSRRRAVRGHRTTVRDHTLAAPSGTGGLTMPPIRVISPPEGRRWIHSTSRRRSTTSTTSRTSGTPTRRSSPTRSRATTACAGRRRCFLTGTDEHGQKIEEAARKAGMTPAGVRRRGRRRGSTRRGSALGIDERRLHPHHRAAPQAGRAAGLGAARARRDGDIYLGDYEGWYCVGCERSTPRASWRTAAARSTTTASRRLDKEPSYFFRLSAYADRLLEHIEAHPDFIRPEYRATRCSSFVRGGLQGPLDLAHQLPWGIPVPGDERSTSSTCGSTR